TDFETSPLRLPGAVRVEPDAIDKPDFALKVAPEQMIVAYCTSPEEATSAAVAQKLRERGFKRVRILKGGLGGGRERARPGGGDGRRGACRWSRSRACRRSGWRSTRT